MFYLLTKGRSRKWINFEAMDAELLQLVMLYEREMQQQKDEDKEKETDEDKGKVDTEEPETK